MGLKYSVNFTVAAFCKSLYFYSHKKCHSLQGIPEKVHITIKFQKTEFDKHNNRGVRAFSVISIYLTH